MISWQVNSSFVYVPLNVNSLSTQGPACPLEHLILNLETVESMMTLCLQKGDPIVFDFSGINILATRAFEVFCVEKIMRPTVFLNVNPWSESRLKDDGVVQDSDSFERIENKVNYWVGTEKVSDLPDNLKAIEGQFYRPYVLTKSDALIDCNKTLTSTSVHATKYYDVRRLCIEEKVHQVAYSHENDRQILFKVTNNYSFKAAVFSI